MSVKLTEDDKRLQQAAKLLAEGLSRKVVAERIGVSPHTLTRWNGQFRELFGDIGLSPSGRRARAAKMRQEIAAEHYKAGKELSEIAEIMGVSPETVKMWRHSRQELFGHTPRKLNPTWEATDPKVIEAAKLFNGGYKLVEVSERSGIPASTISQISRRYTQLFCSDDARSKAFRIRNLKASGWHAPGRKTPAGQRPAIISSAVIGTATAASLYGGQDVDRQTLHQEWPGRAVSVPYLPALLTTHQARALSASPYAPSLPPKAAVNLEVGS